MASLPHNLDLLWYQKAVWDYFMWENGNFAVLMWHRRCGKDVLCFSIMIAQAMKKKGYYLYLFPTQTQAREAMWTGMTSEGMSYIDFVPECAVRKKNQQQMRITLKNGSIIKFDGIDRFHAARGRGAAGIILSEYAHSSPDAYAVVAPMIRKTKGWIIVNSTPWSENHFWQLYLAEKANKLSFTQLLTVDDTNMVTKEEIEEDRRRGMSEQMIQQEYYCNPLSAVPGAYYADEIAKAYEENRIYDFSINPNAPVFSYWDLGVGRNLAIWLMQKDSVKDNLMLIGYYEDPFGCMVNAFKWLREVKALHKINYGPHYLPFDVNTLDTYDGMTRIEKAKRDNPDMEIIPIPQSKSKIAGIDNVKAIFYKLCFHSVYCDRGLAALKEYRSDYDRKSLVYGMPVKNWAEHGADAMRYLAIVYFTMMNNNGPQFKVIR